ncbi:vitamin K epoxide reductase family protein [Streptomyces sp. GD-15H]|uniref:vitamin K epoxide reductase family protein n=1 Tax=Streptomyces sp. GD-15H TaxID=3129112 RepID=UPI0032511608
MVFVHRLIAQSLHSLNKLCPYCAVVWIVTTALFWYVTVHCLDQGILPAPEGCWTSSGTPTGCCSAAWYGVIAVLVLTRF